MSNRRGGRRLVRVDQKDYGGRVAANLRAHRLQRFYTQKEFRDALEAAGLRVTKGAVSHWELGRRFPDIRFLPVIAAVLGITIQQILPDVDRRFDV